MTRGKGSVGGFAQALLVVFFVASLAGVAWAAFADSDQIGSPAFLALTAGFMALVCASSTVYWSVADGKLTVRQYFVPRVIPLSAIEKTTVATSMHWKQGIGIRWCGPEEWAMVCGSRDVVTVTYGEKVFHFSADDGAAIEGAIR
ncbi:hypothetical protein [Corynebacterium heidelbergense]|uniref:hypothetical protein n=1 Tax=Corynebacterium heidelbergense TaxID=2055947 RepID=UPI001057D090|nr:hypothetical protein [Corynebacterium heidelbergense]